MRKKRWLLIGLLLVLVAAFSYSSEFLITVSIDWSIGIRGGVEYRFNRYSGIRGDIGVSMLQVPSMSLFYVMYLMPEDQKLHLNLLLGMPNIMTPFELNPFKAYLMTSFGGSFLIGYDFTESIGADLRLGGGLPLFFGDKDKPILRPLRIPISETEEFPLYFWPDLAASVNFRLK